MHFLLSLCPPLPAGVITEALFALCEISQRSLAANVSAFRLEEPPRLCLSPLARAQLRSHFHVGLLLPGGGILAQGARELMDTV